MQHECTDELKVLIKDGKDMLFEAMADKDRFRADLAVVNLELCLMVKARQTNRY